MFNIFECGSMVIKPFIYLFAFALSATVICYIVLLFHGRYKEFGIVFGIANAGVSIAIFLAVPISADDGMGMLLLVGTLVLSLIGFTIAIVAHIRLRSMKAYDEAADAEDKEYETNEEGPEIHE